MQPQSEIASFRRFLRESGWRVLREDMILEDGKFYPMMRAVPAESALGKAPKGETEKPEKREPIPPELSDRFGLCCFGEASGIVGVFKKRMEKIRGA